MTFGYTNTLFEPTWTWPSQNVVTVWRREVVWSRQGTETLVDVALREPERPRLTKNQVARARSHDAIQAARGRVLPALEERQYHRPKRVGRACGSRHRVMI